MNTNNPIPTAEEVLKSVIPHNCIWEESLDNCPMHYVVKAMHKFASTKQREAAADAWDTCENHMAEQNRYPYGKRGGVYQYPSREQYLDTNYPLK